MKNTERSKGKKSMMQMIRENRIGTVAWLLQLTGSILLMIFVLQSGLLLGSYLAIIAAGMVILLAATAAGSLFSQKKTMQYVFATACLLICAVLLVVGVYVKKTSNTLSEISDNRGEVTLVSVYVFDKDQAQHVKDAADYDFGILDSLDRENTEQALAMLEKDVNQKIKTVTADSITSVADEMMDDEVQAIVMNEAYMEILSEWEEEGSETRSSQERDYSAFVSSLRRIATYEIKSSRQEKTAIDEEQFILYISGIDTWGDISTRSRSDVNIMAVVNTESRQLLLVTTPRDYYVPLSVSDGVRDKLTHAGIYGVQCSVDTLSMLYDIEIDYYFRVNFSGFEKIIDALGGITVWSDYEFHVEPDFDYGKGENELNGIEALAFARERYTLPGGDAARAQNQMNVIISVADKLTSAALLTNYAGILDSLDGTFETDMPYDALAALVRQQLLDGGEWDTITYAVSGTSSMAGTYSMGNTQLYVIEPDQKTLDRAKMLIRKVQAGETITDADLSDIPKSVGDEVDGGE